MALPYRGRQDSVRPRESAGLDFDAFERRTWICKADSCVTFLANPLDPILNRIRQRIAADFAHPYLIVVVAAAVAVEPLRLRL